MKFNTVIVPSSSSSSASEARADANRRNAQASTGPRTEEGKARSAQNARRSGWFARDLRVAEGQEELYLNFEAALRDEIQPEGILEEDAFTDYVRASWHKREIIAAQNEAMASGPAAFLQNEPKAARDLDRLHRYERDFERRAARHLRELRQLQTERALRAPIDEPSAPPLTAAKVLAQKRSQALRQPPLDIPEDLRISMHVMTVETAHWNAKLRARKAGLLDESSPS